jgi:hypothetical protein
MMIGNETTLYKMGLTETRLLYGWQSLRSHFISTPAMFHFQIYYLHTEYRHARFHSLSSQFTHLIFLSFETY